MATRTHLRRRGFAIGLTLLLFAGGAVMIGGWLLRAVGGAFTRPPEIIDVTSGELDEPTRRLIDAAFEGIDSERMVDFHVHLVGLDGGAYVNARMRSAWHPVERIKFAVYTSACGIEDVSDATSQFRKRLLSLIDHFPGRGRFAVLAFDQNHDSAGQPDPTQTEFYTPNDHALALRASRPDRIIAVGSVHPYRADAAAEIERLAHDGIRIIKWLPNAMNIDPADPRCDATYAAMKRHGMVLLSHGGEEKAVDAEGAQRLGNPLRLRRPLDAGVRVIVAHAASLGRGEDLDAPDKPLVENFDLFLRLMSEPRYEGLVFGDISAVLQFNRLPRPLLELLERQDLHARLVNGSDYPLPAINALVRTRDLVALGLLTEEERRALNRIYDFNPLLFDFVTKRTLHHPKTGARFPASLFAVPAALAPL